MINERREQVSRATQHPPLSQTARGAGRASSGKIPAVLLIMAFPFIEWESRQVPLFANPPPIGQWFQQSPKDHPLGSTKLFGTSLRLRTDTDPTASAVSEAAWALIQKGN